MMANMQPGSSAQFIAFPQALLQASPGAPTMGMQQPEWAGQAAVTMNGVQQIGLPAFVPATQSQNFANYQLVQPTVTSSATQQYMPMATQQYMPMAASQPSPAAQSPGAFQTAQMAGVAPSNLLGYASQSMPYNGFAQRAPAQGYAAAGATMMSPVALQQQSQGAVFSTMQGQPGMIPGAQFGAFAPQMQAGAFAPQMQSASFAPQMQGGAFGAMPGSQPGAVPQSGSLAAQGLQEFLANPHMFEPHHVRRPAVAAAPVTAPAPAPAQVSAASRTAELESEIIVLNKKLEDAKSQSTKKYGAMMKDSKLYFENKIKGNTTRQKKVQANGKQTPVYFLTADGAYCPEGSDITSMDECRDASKALGYKWATEDNPWYGAMDHRYCLFQDDGFQKAYFNTAGKEASPQPPHQNYASICLQSCADTVLIAGGEALEPACMGTFTKSVITPSLNHSGRTIYENGKGKHLYFWKPAGNWIIETDGHFDNAFGALFAHSDVRCPEEALGWKIWDNNTWSTKHAISVTKVVDPVKPEKSQVDATLSAEAADPAEAAEQEMEEPQSEASFGSDSSDGADDTMMLDSAGASAMGSGLRTGPLPKQFGGRGELRGNIEPVYFNYNTEEAERYGAKAEAEMEYYGDEDVQAYMNKRPGSFMQT